MVEDNGHLYKIGIGRTHTKSPIVMLIIDLDLDIRIIHAATGGILRQLTLNPTNTYQPTDTPRNTPKRQTPEPR